MTILKLTRSIIIDKISEFIEIDKVIDTDEKWQHDNFIMDFDGKWDNSYVLLSNNEIVGYIICSIKNDRKCLHIHRLAVKKEYQKRGIGKSLIDKTVIDTNKCIKYITLKVHKDNIIAKRFYEKNGFKNLCIVGDHNIYRKDLMTTKILAMGAHPDDMELEAGGSLAKFAKKGYDVYLLILTVGGYTDMKGNIYYNEQLRDEATKASKILGIKDVTFLNYSTKNLQANGDTVTQVDSIIEKLNPDVLISHHPFDSHQDHKAAADIMFAVSRQGRVKNILSGSTLPYRPNVFAFRPQFFVDITETLETKLNAIRAYETQYKKFGGETLIEQVKSMAIHYGWAMGYKYAECFEVIRMDDSLWL